METKNALLLSLGHNSSAIFTDGDWVIGYEQERLDRIKSSSAPPLTALKRICDNTKVPKGTPMFVTHWFDQWEKLYDHKYTSGLHGFARDNGFDIVTHTPDFTHHDAHAWSSLSFYNYYKNETYRKMTRDEQIETDISYKWFLVADGFGNKKEVLSLYKSLDGKNMDLEFRVYGYQHSLGLMYQYATDFCGMKMNQDEYKFLGYESEATWTLNPNQKTIVDEMASKEVSQFIFNWSKHNTEPVYASTSIIDYDNLNTVKEYWHAVFAKLLDNIDYYAPTSDISRVAIGYFIQQILEKSLVKLVKTRGIKNLILSGGVFYNVKANHALLKAVDGLFSVVPLAGDQGASIGFYQKFVGQFNWETLCIGNRNMEQFESDQFKNDKSTLIIYDEQHLVETLYAKLSAGQICNLITNKMEYGPRALGATSSLFLPTEMHAEFNNKLNSRNEVMPFAPMIAEEAMPKVFEQDYRRVVGSDRFMITTYDYKMPISDDVRGVYHVYPYNVAAYSGRPEVIEYSRNRPLHRVLTDLWFHNDQLLLTNTSYNYHGEPIVFSAEDVFKTHKRQSDNWKAAHGQVPKVNLIIYKVKSNDG